MKQNVPFLATILVLVLCFASYASAQWVQTNGSNSVSAIVINGSDIFAGTPSSGVSLSSDSGTNWTSAVSGLPMYSVVSSLAIDGTNLFAGIDGGGI